jgi:catechol 2,3-dioxygenase-like lactoylglutathione lyase family enzyme
MPIVSFDHVAIPTKDAERFIAFYKRLGFTVADEEAWRQGKARIFSIQFGDSKINVHPPGYTATLRGPTAVPGCGDFCFVWEGGLAALQAMLKEADVEVILGPAPRRGGRGDGSIMATSMYIRDPDDNLLEFMVYE